MFKDLRFKLFQFLLVPFSAYCRKRRANLMIDTLQLKVEHQILDVGGQPDSWDYIKLPLNITCLNLCGIMNTSHKTHHNITYMIGDGCNMPQFKPGQFDLVYCNSVIEHVGNKVKRGMLAQEIRRISKCYWLQTPYEYYPIEAHCGMPFWWFYPEAMRAFFINKWKKKLPAWTEMVETTVVVGKKELKELFPESEVFFEWVLLPKSLIAYSK